MAKNYDKPKNEYYPTTQKAIQDLFEIIDFKNMVEEGWTFAEPCRGEEQAIYQHMPEGSQWCELSEGKDYLTNVWDSRPDCIITNPPFSLSVPFLEKSLSEADVCIYLNRLSFLESKERYHFNKDNPPTNMIVLSQRPKFKGKGNDQQTCAWFIYDYEKRLGLTEPFYFIL